MCFEYNIPTIYLLYIFYFFYFTVLNLLNLLSDILTYICYILIDIYIKYHLIDHFLLFTFCFISMLCICPCCAATQYFTFGWFYEKYSRYSGRKDILICQKSQSQVELVSFFSKLLWKLLLFTFSLIRCVVYGPKPGNN